MTIQYGLIGLGNMGVPIAKNLIKKNYQVLVYDINHPKNRAPEKSKIAETLEEVWHLAEAVFLCLPKGDNCKTVLQSLINCDNRLTSTIIELSTIGMPMAKELDSMLQKIKVDYIDSPMSGGVSGAQEGSLTLMCSGKKLPFNKHHEALKAISKNIFHLGIEPGKGQAMKLINNFMAATGLAVTAEAMTYGTHQGIDLKTMLDVVNVSTGSNVASLDKFPKRVLTGTYDANFYTKLLSKDVALFNDGLKADSMKGYLAPLVDSLWKDVDKSMPGSDMTEIYKFMQKKLKDNT